MRPLRNLVAACLGASALELGSVVAFNQISEMDVGLIFGALSLLIAVALWLLILFWSTLISVRLLGQRQWFLGLLPPLIPVLAFLASYSAIPYVQYPQDYAHFSAKRSSYDAAVAKLPKDGARYKEFNWGGMLFASKGVVYDETDEVGLPFGKQSDGWKERMRNTDLTCGGDGPIGEVIPLGDHYYVAGFGC